VIRINQHCCCNWLWPVLPTVCEVSMTHLTSAPLIRCYHLLFHHARDLQPCRGRIQLAVIAALASLSTALRKSGPTRRRLTLWTASSATTGDAGSHRVISARKKEGAVYIPLPNTSNLRPRELSQSLPPPSNPITFWAARPPLM
jgi:hypothetical protein